MSYSLNPTAGAYRPERFWGSDGASGADVWGKTPPGATAAAPNIDRMVQAARLGDDAAFSWLADFYRTAAERLAQQIMHTEEAGADAVQEALIKAHRAMSRFQDGNFRSWFLRIVTNTCYDHLRRQKRRATISLDELYEQSNDDFPLSGHGVECTGDDDPEVLVIQNESMRVLLRAIDDLPAWHRTVVLLVDVQGYDYAEAAQLLDLPLGTVKSRLSRARSALRDHLVRSGVVVSKM